MWACTSPRTDIGPARGCPWNRTRAGRRLLRCAGAESVRRVAGSRSQPLGQQPDLRRRRRGRHDLRARTDRWQLLNDRGETVNVLTGGDPREVTTRTESGAPGGANKAIALKNARNIVFKDFSLKNGGHFAIIGTGVVGWTVDNIVVDTNRDAYDIDASQNVTIRNSVFNSLTDDAIVLKGTFGLGTFTPTRNVSDRRLYRQRLRCRIGHRQGVLDPEAGRDRSRRPDGPHQARDRGHHRLRHHHDPPRHLRPVAGFCPGVGRRRRTAKHRADRRHDEEREQLTDLHPARRPRPHAGHRKARKRARDTRQLPSGWTTGAGCCPT